jgi:predicted helicase
VNEKDNNKNRKYPVMDDRIAKTYKKDSKARLQRKLDDPYVKAIRWASDRIGDNGIVGLVTNSSFMTDLSFDGMRKHLLKDFSRIYCLDLKGNVRKDSMRDGIPIGEQHTVFGLAAMVGIAVTFFVKSKSAKDHRVHYWEVDWRSKREEKFTALERAGSVGGIRFRRLHPNAENTWMTEGLDSDFGRLIPLSADSKASADKSGTLGVFDKYSLGVSTNRDSVVYDFDRERLLERVEQFCDDYNAEVARYQQKAKPANIDNFVRYDKVKWSERLKRGLTNGTLASAAPERICASLYRPFAISYLFLDPLVVDRPGLFRRIFPPQIGHRENRVVCLPSLGGRARFWTLATNHIPNLNLMSVDATQSFPFYVYDEDGSNRKENITDWALEQFREHYGDKKITKWDIFHYVYAVLHHPIYRERYAANLKRELPRVPYAPDFRAFAKAGKKLMELHVDYERQSEYRLEKIEKKDAKLNFRVERMKLAKDKTAVIYNDFLTLGGVPLEVFEYRLGNRSALDWVIDQYRVKADKRSGIVSDPNRANDPEYIVRLIGQVITVSLETIKITRSLPDLGVPTD